MRVIKQHTMVIVLIVSFLLMFCGCSLQTEENEKQDSILLLSGVWKDASPQMPDFSQITGGVNARCNKTQLYDLIISDQLTLTQVDQLQGRYAFEVVIAVPENEYFAVIQSDRSSDEISVLTALAYSYETENVYLFLDEKCFLVDDPESLKMGIGELFSKSGYYFDTKFFWLKNDISKAYSVANKEKSRYFYCLSFRYQRYWCLDQPLQENDFTSLDGYLSDNLESMIVNAAELLGYTEFEAYVADDILTGYWRVEFYDMNSDQNALIYFDDRFEILFGIY